MTIKFISLYLLFPQPCSELLVIFQNGWVDVPFQDSKPSKLHFPPARTRRSAGAKKRKTTKKVDLVYRYRQTSKTDTPELLEFHAYTLECKSLFISLFMQYWPRESNDCSMSVKCLHLLYSFKVHAKLLRNKVFRKSKSSFQNSKTQTLLQKLWRCKPEHRSQASLAKFPISNPQNNRKLTKKVSNFSYLTISANKHWFLFKLCVL